MLQDIVDEVLAQGVWTTRVRRLCGQELVEVRPSIRLAVTAALSRKECERAAAVMTAAVTKVLAKRKCVHLLLPELSPSYDTFALGYTIPVHIACPLLCIISITII